jgi:hypothetical protein
MITLNTVSHKTADLTAYLTAYYNARLLSMKMAKEAQLTDDLTTIYHEA